MRCQVTCVARKRTWSSQPRGRSVTAEFPQTDAPGALGSRLAPDSPPPSLQGQTPESPASLSLDSHLNSNISTKKRGAMGIRTPDLLHAISRQPVHRSPSPQVTVLSSAPGCALVRPGCGTSVLYSLQAVAR